MKYAQRSHQRKRLHPLKSGCLLFPAGKGELRKILPRTIHSDSRWALEGRARPRRGTRRDIPNLGLKAVEISELQQESGRQVGRSAGRQVGLSPSRAVHRDGRGWDAPGGDACCGPPRRKSPPDGLTAETPARRRWLSTRLRRVCSSNASGIQGGQPFSSTVRFLRGDRGPGASEDRCRRRFCVARRLGHGSRRCGLPLAHPQVAGGVLQHLHVVALQEVRAGEGGVDGGMRIVGQVVGQDRVGRGPLQDR